MSRFKDRLWSDLVRVHGPDLSQLSHPPAKSRPRPRVLAGTGLGLVAAGSAAAVLLGTAGTTPAFAVTRNNDGSVTVSIARPGGIPQANARLAELGYRARIVQVIAGCGGPAAWTRRIQPPPGAFRQVRAGARFDPRLVPPGRVLVMPAWRLRGTITIHRGPVVNGQVPACLPPPLPPGALPGWAVPGGLPGPILARSCVNVRGQWLPGPRRFQMPGEPRLQIPGGGQLKISGGPHLQITAVPRSRIASGRQLQITAGGPNRHGRAWIHVSVSCPAPMTSRVPAPGQSRPSPTHP